MPSRGSAVGRRAEDHDPTKADAVETSVAIERLSSQIEAGNTARDHLHACMERRFDELLTHVDEHDNRQIKAVEAQAKEFAEFKASVAPLIEVIGPVVSLVKSVKKYAVPIVLALFLVIFFGGPMASKLSMELITKLIGN